MSENLKRAESLFNRIMNQNKPAQEPPARPYRNHHRDHNGHSNGHSNGSHRDHHRNHRSHNKYSHQNNHSANFDLPKKDPVKEAREAVDALDGTQHVLPYCWTIWHHSRMKPKGEEEREKEQKEKEAKDKDKGPARVDSYLQAASEIEFLSFSDPSRSVKPIASLEQMWTSMAMMKKSHEMATGSEILIFKTGVNPVWEDPINAKGGRWVFRFSHKSPGSEKSESAQSVRRRTTLIWERLVLRTLTGSLMSGKKDHQDALLSDIVGLVLSVRKDEVIISLWNCNLHFSKRRDDEEKRGVLTGFAARRSYSEAFCNVVKEVDQILQGSDYIDTDLVSTNDRVGGAVFEYRFHSENKLSYKERSRRGNGHHHHKEEKEETA